MSRPVPIADPATSGGLLLVLVRPVLLLLGLTSLWSATAQESPISVIQVPLEIDLAPVFAAADTALPSQAGGWPHWEPWHGLEARYQAWRGTLGLAIQGPVIQAQAHVRYRLQVRKGLIGGLGLSAGCGVDEPPRQALIGVLARLDWTPDWALHPRFRVLPTRPLDPCELTVADIDVSPLVGRAFESRLESALGDALGKLAPRLSRLRGEATRAWQGLQTPRELAPGLWLHVRPLGIALAPPLGSDASLKTSLWLAARLTLSGDQALASAPVPLPPLMPYRPVDPGLRFAISLQVDYPRLSEAIAARLVGQSVDVEGRAARLEALVVRSQGEDLVLEATLGGDLSGRLTLMARPGFDPTGQSLTLEGLDYVFDADDAEIGLAANLFYDRIRGRIQETANGLLAERTDDLSMSLRGILGDALPAALTPRVSDLRLGSLAITVEATGLRLAGTAEGVLALGGERRSR